MIESEPSVAEALRVSSIATGVASGFSSALARLRASCSVKRPVMTRRPAVDRPIVDARSRLHFTVEHDREAGAFLVNLFRQIAEFLSAFAIEIQHDAPAALIEKRVGRSDVVASEIRLFPHQQTPRRFPVLILLDLILDFIPRRKDCLAGIDLLEQRIALRMHQAEFQLRDFLQLLARFLDPLGAERRNLHEDSVLPLRADHRLADAERIDPLPNHLDGLGLLALIGCIWIFVHQPDEERRAALQIEPEPNLLLHRPDGIEAERDH